MAPKRASGGATQRIVSIQVSSSVWWKWTTCSISGARPPSSAFCICTRASVAVRLELAQAQKRPAGGLVRQLDELRESRLRIPRTGRNRNIGCRVKPAFRPFRLELESLFVEIDGLWHLVGVAHGGSPGDFLKI